MNRGETAKVLYIGLDACDPETLLRMAADGSAPNIAALLDAFHARTGIPVLLNTSFNRRGMPMVERPEEAVALFAETALDALVLQDVLVRKRTG